MEDEFQRRVKLVEKFESRSSGNVEAVGRALEIEEEVKLSWDMVWFETTGPGRANEEPIPQPRGIRPTLSALMISAA